MLPTVLSTSALVPPPKSVGKEWQTGLKKEDGATDETADGLSVLLAVAQPDEIIFVVRPCENPAGRQKNSVAN